MRMEAGLTLVELLVTLAVLGVLLGIGVPAFGGLMQESRLTAATNRFVGALHATRSEAVRRNLRVTLCKSADSAQCAETGGWQQGWIIFVDTDATGTRSADDPILAVGGSIPDGVAIAGNSPVEHYISYVGLGSTRRANGSLQMGTITLCAGDSARRIVISRTGRARVELAQCGA